MLKRATFTYLVLLPTPFCRDLYREDRNGSTLCVELNTLMSLTMFLEPLFIVTISVRIAYVAPAGIRPRISKSLGAALSQILQKADSLRKHHHSRFRTQQMRDTFFVFFPPRLLCKTMFKVNKQYIRC